VAVPVEAVAGAAESAIGEDLVGQILGTAGQSGILSDLIITPASVMDFTIQQNEKNELRRAQAKKEALYERQRRDALRQQTVANLFAKEQMAQNEAAFNFGKQQWGEEFGFTKQQYKDKQKQIKEAMKKQGLAEIQSQIGLAMAQDSNLKDNILTRFGV